jgi:organic hydroperoxide reductase OsmC/OhrA
MNAYPMIFKAKANSESGIQTSWSTEAEKFNHQIPMAIPPEFDGPGTGLSPEDLYAMALQNCFVATFKVFAEKSKLSFQSVSVDAKLEVDRDEKGRPWMARVHLKVSLKGAAQVDNARRILERASQNCMILNSVKTEKTFEFDVDPGPQ